MIAKFEILSGSMSIKGIRYVQGDVVELEEDSTFYSISRRRLQKVSNANTNIEGKKQTNKTKSNTNTNTNTNTKTNPNSAHKAKIISDPSSHSAAELLTLIDSISNPDELIKLSESEEKGRNRSEVMIALQEKGKSLGLEVEVEEEEND